MNLFIEHAPAQAGEVFAPTGTPRGQSAAEASSGPAAPGAPAASAAPVAAADLEEPSSHGAGRIAPVRRSGYSLAQETYRKELDFDRARAQRKKRAGVARAIAVVVLVPLLLLASFVFAYTLTCILQGATPEEVGQMLAALARHALALPGMLTRG